MRYKDIKGMKFGRLIVVEYYGADKHKNALWECQCDCGNTKLISGNNLRKGITKSCGCLQKELLDSIRPQQYREIQWATKGDITYGVIHNGRKFVIDTSDLPLVSNVNWFVSADNRVVSSKTKKHPRIVLSRLIMGVTKYSDVVDHVNGDTLDNRRNNLRICSHDENCRNIKRKSNNTSGYTGVSFNKVSKKWYSYIGYKGKRIGLGYYDAFEEAVDARRRAEIEYHGEFNGEIRRNDYIKIKKRKRHREAGVKEREG